MESPSLLIESVNKFVRKNIGRPISIMDIASATGYSEGYIRAVFRNNYGISLGRYVRESRLSEASRLLQRGDKNVSEVASSCGFDSIESFSRSFKNTFGISPKKLKSKP